MNDILEKDELLLKLVREYLNCKKLDISSILKKFDVENKSRHVIKTLEQIKKRVAIVDIENFINYSSYNFFAEFMKDKNKFIEAIYIGGKNNIHKMSLYCFSYFYELFYQKIEKIEYFKNHAIFILNEKADKEFHYNGRLFKNKFIIVRYNPETKEFGNELPFHVETLKYLIE